MGVDEDDESLGVSWIVPLLLGYTRPEVPDDVLLPVDELPLEAPMKEPLPLGYTRPEEPVDVLLPVDELPLEAPM